ncbi:MAG: hypothetical protein RL757_3130 [Bacteroidota bacterium]|jgi:hypothetical protein
MSFMFFCVFLEAYLRRIFGRYIDYLCASFWQPLAIKFFSTIF